MDISTGVILVSIVIGISTNLLTPYVSNSLGWVSGSIRQRNDAKKKVFEKTVEFVLSNYEEEIILRLRYMHRNIISLVLVLGGIVTMRSSNVWEITIGFLIYLWGLYNWNKTVKLGRILQEVKKRRKSQTKGIDLD